MCPRQRVAPQRASLFQSYRRNLPSSFNILLSSALVFSTRPPVSVSGTALYTTSYFLDLNTQHTQSIKHILNIKTVTNSRLRNINLISIHYGFRPRVRHRLTLRRLTLRRNPWTLGESVSHTLSRYSCQHSHFRCLQHTSRYTFSDLRNAPLPI